MLPDGRRRTSVRVRVAGETSRLWFTTPADVPFVERNRGDIWLPPLMVLAMSRRERLVLADPISLGREADLRRVQGILATWYPDRMARVQVVSAPPEPRRLQDRLRRRLTGDDRVTATCFTGGVDSFDTLIRRRQALGAIVYGFGLDIPLREKAASDRLRPQLASVATANGVRLLTANTNVRAFLRGRLVWGSEAHGAVLASLGTIMSPLISTLYVPGTYTYDYAPAWGTHPLLDHRWSTSRLRIEHDGADRGRARKVRRLSRDESAQRTLRVCWRQYQATNCGRCMKCVRTMTTLQILGRLDRFETFPDDVDEAMVRSITLTSDREAFMIRDLLKFADRITGHGDLKEALVDVLEDFDARQAASGESARRPMPIR